jgi:hypothetical protein
MERYLVYIMGSVSLATSRVESSTAESATEKERRGYRTCIKALTFALHPLDSATSCLLLRSSLAYNLRINQQ